MQKVACRYPNIYIRSKNDLAKRLSGENISFKATLRLINDVIDNFDYYWYDNIKVSKPKEEKFFRSSYGTPLGRLLKLIDKKILAPYDHMLPDFIFGGVSGKDHVGAAYSLLGKRRRRSKLGLDIKRFFEQNKLERVECFFQSKCNCSKKVAKLLAKICCVPVGPKGSNSSIKALARGFSTSTRLATWTNLDLFLRVSWLVKKRLKLHDAKLAIFIDDIGITASKVDRKDLENLKKEIESLLNNHDQNQQLSLNNKTSIQIYSETNCSNLNHLGLDMGRNKIGIGAKTKSRQALIQKRLKEEDDLVEKARLIRIKKSYNNYQKYIKSKKLSTK